MPDWVTRAHPDLDTILDRHRHVDDLYSGNALEKARDKAEEIAEEDGLTPDDVTADDEENVFNRRPDLGNYLFRRAQGENPQAFDERARLSRFPNQFSQIVDSHVGAVQQAGYKMDRWVDPDTGEGPLGDPEDPESTARQFKQNADGDGTSWDTMMTRGITTLYKDTRLWYLVEGPTDRHPQPRVIWLKPESVRNWYPKSGAPKELIVAEERDMRTSVKDKHNMETVYVHYTVDGWKRYDSDGEPISDDVIPDAEGEWDNPFWETPEQNERILPAGYVDLQIPRDVPYQMAEGEKYLFNLLSDIRMALRIAAHPKLWLDASDQQANDTLRMLLKGANVLFADNADFITLPWDKVAAAREMYKEEVKEYREASFQQLNDAAKEATATEIKQKDQRGRQAWLIHLSRKADELENSIRFRLAQIMAPDNPDQWRIPRVERSTDYAPMDPDQESQSLKDMFFPDGSVPASQSTLKEAAKKIHDLQGVPESDDEGLNAAITVGSGRPSDARMARLRQRVENAQANGEA